MSIISKESIADTIEGLEQLVNRGIQSVHIDMAIAGMRRLLAMLEAEPVAWDYEWASCITCEGPQNFKRIIEHEVPPEWAIHEGQARNLIPLYAAPPAPVSVPVALNRLRSIVADKRALPRRKEWISGQQYSYVLLENVEAMVDDACRAAMLQGADVNTDKPLTIELPDISSKAFWSGTGKNETFHPGTYRRWVKEAIERSCNIARVDVEVK